MWEAHNTNQCYDIFTLHAKEDSLRFWTQYLCRAPAIEWPCRTLRRQATEEATVDGLLVTQNLAEPVSVTVFGNAGEIQEPLSSGFTPGVYCA